MNLNDRLGGEENTFVSSDSVYLTDYLLNLDYDPMRVCRCAPVFEVTAEFGGPYGVTLSQGYAWCEKGQADLTQELAACAPFTADYPIPDHGAMYYLCENGACKATVDSLSKLRII